MGDDLNSFSSLTDSLSEIGTEFQNKINSGIPIYGLGNAAKIFGEYYISNTDKDEYASYYGVMTNNIGTDIFGDMIFQPMIFENSDFFENRTSALLLGLMRNRKRFGIYCDGTDYIFINKINKTLSAYGDLPIIVLDAKSTTIIDSSHYITNRTLSRQTVGMNNLRLTVSNLSKEYSIEKGELLELTEIEAEPNIEDKFILMQNYPNPFNGQTQISFLINKNSWVNLSVYDLLGNKIAELVNKEMKPGEYLTYFDATNFKSSLSSGVYFYSLKIAGSTAVRKMIFLK